MEYVVGIMLGLVVAAFATTVGLDRGRSFYPTVAIVVASYYALFGVIGGSRPILLVEIAIGLAFAACAVAGFKGSMWLVAAALAGHGVFDLFHHLVIQNTGMPVWWPGFCAGADLSLGGWMAFRLLKGYGHRV